MKKENLIVIGSFLVLILLICFFYYLHDKKEETYSFHIYFFNAGKADAIVLSKNNHYLMIDTGEQSLSGEIIQYFKNQHIQKLDYLILTHFDKDHIGNAARILKEVEVGEVLQSNVPKKSDSYDKYLSALYKKNVLATTVSKNYQISFEGVEITVNGPEKVYDKNESNNSSLIVSIKDNQNSFLFMGDAENARIKDFLEENTNTYQFLKIPYHGHSLKQMDTLLEKIQPTIAVITSSDQEKEDEDTIAMLNQHQVKTYLTRKGPITVLSNGKELIIKQ